MHDPTHGYFVGSDLRRGGISVGVRAGHPAWLARLPEPRSATLSTLNFARRPTWFARSRVLNRGYVNQ